MSDVDWANVGPGVLAALEAVRAIIAEGAAVGFVWDRGGDWAERLYTSQQATSAAIAAAKGDGR